MQHIEGSDRDQLTLFPEALDDYIAQDNPVRFLDAFIDALDLAALAFTHPAPKDTGRPPYHPADLLKLYVYGYLNRLRSSRLLEREAGRNLELMWLLKRLTPDFKTIADFRRDNRQAIRQVCRQFTLFCRQLDLFGGELVAIPQEHRDDVDGSKFKARTAKAVTSPTRSSSANSRTSTRRSTTTSKSSTKRMKKKRTRLISPTLTSFGRRSKP